MSVWTTKSLERDRVYIVLQHTLKGVNYVVNGVKFRNSYAVVEKDSKTYHSLKKVPVLRSAKEFPLTHLKKLAFITRTIDIKTVYGQDVYRRFLEEENKEKLSQASAAQAEQEALVKISYEQREEAVKLKQEIEQKITEAKESGNTELVEQLKEAIPSIEKCTYRLHNDNLCSQKAFEHSPAKYCYAHLFNEPALKELGIEIPELMTKKEKKALREKIEKILEKNFK